jgi:hypothetical protein
VGETSVLNLSSTSVFEEEEALEAGDGVQGGEALLQRALVLEIQKEIEKTLAKDQQAQGMCAVDESAVNDESMLDASQMPRPPNVQADLSLGAGNKLFLLSSPSPGRKHNVVTQ